LTLTLPITCAIVLFSFQKTDTKPCSRARPETKRPAHSGGLSHRIGWLQTLRLNLLLPCTITSSLFDRDRISEARCSAMKLLQRYQGANDNVKAIFKEMRVGHLPVLRLHCKTLRSHLTGRCRWRLVQSYAADWQLRSSQSPSTHTGS